MQKKVSKSKFKAHALEYFREVEESGNDIIVTNFGKPTIKISRYTEDPEALLKSLRNTLVKYDEPFESVAENEWEVLK